MKSWGIVAILITMILSGCATSPYQQAKQDIARQYAELEQITDPMARQQRFQEIAHKEAMLETQETRRQQVGAALIGATMLYRAQSRPRTYNVYMIGNR